METARKFRFVLLAGFVLLGVVGYLAENWWLAGIGVVGVLGCAAIPAAPSAHVAIDKGWKAEKIMGLLKKADDIHAQDAGGNTPLHIAARCDRGDLVPLLVERGAEVNAANRRGNTPLHWAARFNACAAAAALLECGADASARNEDGLTPGERARLSGYAEMMRILGVEKSE